MRWRTLGASLLGLALAVCCGEDEATQANAGDAGFDARDATSDARDAASEPDGQSDARPRDAGSEEALECKGEYPIAIDAEAPPPDCVPPCLWELKKNCPPPGFFGTPDYERRVVDDPLCFPERCSRKVYANGCRCYGYSFACIPPSCAVPTTVWSDSAGRTVARSDLNPETVYCGACYFTPVFPTDGGLPSARWDACDGGTVTAYTVDLTQPHCAPWRDFYESL